jgi:lipopolysaccharide transport system ATP-binding protein
MHNTDIAIRVEHIKKIYRIGVKDKIHDSFGKALFDFVKSPLKNYRQYQSLYTFKDVDTAAPDMPVEQDDIIWAIKDVSFEVKKGEVLGLIGGNGAGKSTLLKILARITDPTSGRAEVHGRISSLLEVGTGFHNELTGRENVFLNGTILGMSKKEIDLKFDEIIDFSGVEKFIDTPVKRYSSGMKVRLAFAVAAFMEPEILLVDEVLAVGDASFQAKCMGKMREVSGQGRTVIFVSHHMASIEHLCKRVILLEDGRLKMDADPEPAIAEYCRSISNVFEGNEIAAIPRRKGFTPVIRKVEFIDPGGLPVSSVLSGDPLTVRIHYQNDDTLKDPFFGFTVETLMGVKIFWAQTKMQKGPLPDLAQAGVVECTIPRLPLVAGTYFLTFGCGAQSQQLDHIERACQLHVTESDVFGTGRNPNPKIAMIFVDADWKVTEGLAN